MLTENLVRIRFLNHRLHVTYAWLVIVDALLFFGACYLATWIYFIPQENSLNDHIELLPARAAIFSVMTILAMLSMGLYQPRMREGINGILLRTLGAFALMTLGMSTILYFFPDLHIWRGVFVYSVIIAFVFSMFSRLMFTRTVKLGQFNRRVLVLGAGKRANNIASRMRRKSDYHGFRICGYVRVPDEETVVATGKVITLQQPLSDYVRSHNIHTVVVALDNQHDSMPAEELMRCRTLKVAVVGLLDFFEQEAGKILVDEASPEWFIFSNGFKYRAAGDFFKRALDILGALCLLTVSWPLILASAIAIKFEDGWRAPVLFKQRRVGLNGRLFNVMKLRSMTTDAEGDGKARWATANDARITRVGQIIRKLRIDELPQIFNVLIGDMSLVGPRPERPEFICELEKEIAFFDKRHCVKPGVTGWAQLNYPYGSSISDAKNKLEFDLYYVKNQSIFLDFMVLLQTAEVVIFGKGAH
jgi:sugar transferase (PEP-CTERM system associated)